MKMNRQVLAGAIVLTTVLMGCGDNTKTIEGDVAVKDNGARTEAEAAAMQETKAVAGSTENASVEYRGYALIYNGVAIEIDADAAPIVEQLGEPDSYFEAPSCAFEGIDKIYTYGSMELDTYPMEKEDYVSTIVFKDDIITTTEGIGIGDTVEKMEAVYGAGWTDAGGMAVYEKDGMKLCFILEGDSIISVEYRSMVIDV